MSQLLLHCALVGGVIMMPLPFPSGVISFPMRHLTSFGRYGLLYVILILVYVFLMPLSPPLFGVGSLC